MEYLGRFTAFVITLVLNTIIIGYTFSVLWGWFIVTTFGVRPLSIPESLGIMVIWSYLKIKRDSDKQEDDLVEELVKVFFFTVIISAWILLIGWILTLFM